MLERRRSEGGGGRALVRLNYAAWACLGVTCLSLPGRQAQGVEAKEATVECSQSRLDEAPRKECQIPGMNCTCLAWLSDLIIGSVF